MDMGAHHSCSYHTGVEKRAHRHGTDELRARKARARAEALGPEFDKGLSPEVTTVANDTIPTYYPIVQHLSNPALLGALLSELTFSEWISIWSLTKEVRKMLEDVRELREEVLERYLGVVGYARWKWDPIVPEPLRLTLKELAMYMRGVSTPPFEYAEVAAAAFLPDRTPEQIEEERGLRKGARAYTRLVMRLREQAETEEKTVATIRRMQSSTNGHGNGFHPSPGRRASGTVGGPPPAWGSTPPKRAFSRQSNRAPSPAHSIYSHGNGQNGSAEQQPSFAGVTFRSPLFRLRRAPLLRVFVPSAEGEWLSDDGVLECENELKKAGVLSLMRPGDIVWDMALGDEANIGRMVWDGRYLIVSIDQFRISPFVHPSTLEAC